jgi:hypothetical protein
MNFGRFLETKRHFADLRGSSIPWFTLSKAAQVSGCAFISHLFHRVFRLKSLLKEVKTELQTRAVRGVERHQKRVCRKLVATKRLGHGKYEDYKEPVLLPDELKSDLRSLKPQGNILAGKSF